MKDPIRLLHLDDDATERAELGRLARDQNPPWSITPAGGLAEARALLAVESFDVIVTEARLPDGATFELFPDGNAAAGRTMLLVTGRGDEGTAARALEALVQAARVRDARPTGDLAALGAGLVSGVGLFELDAVLVVQVRHVGWREQRPAAFFHDAAHEQVGNPVGGVHVVRAAAVVTGVFAQF